MSNRPPLIDALLQESAYPHPVERIDLIETHISWVLLTGDFAYKIKRPVVYDFVDFSDLSDRKTYCEKELELNSRLAPELYRDVVPITGKETSPSVNGTGDVREYAVKMHEFPQENLLSSQIDRGDLTTEALDNLAVIVSDFHRSIDDTPPDEDYASRELIQANVRENFEAIETDHLEGGILETFRWVREWSEERFEELASLIELRRRNGSVRNCHGDMHLRNIVEYAGDINVFDCIEFNESFRWIDVMDEIAFLTMDLTHRGRSDLAHRFLDRYLVNSNQYAGLPLLNFYRVYRAMVRCKISYLSDGSNPDKQLPNNFYDYLKTARSFTRTPEPVLIITHGLSGAGKTSVSQTLLERIGALRLRSDIERKRMAGVPFKQDGSDATDRDLYSKAMTVRTYDVLKNKAETVLQAGFPVIVDATFLKRNFRREFRSLAEQLEVPFRIINVTCEESELRRRLWKRQDEGDTVSDAGVNVLDQQLDLKEPLTPEEQTRAVEIPTDNGGVTEDVLQAFESLTEH